jgi:hypothetical protein
MDPATNVLHALMEAQLNEAYYRKRAESFTRADFSIRCAVAVLSTGAVVAFGQSFAGPWAHLWQALSILAAILSVLSPILQLSERARRLSDLAGRWTGVAGELRLLDLGRQPEESDGARFLRLVEKSEGLQREDTAPRKKGLVKKLQGEVVHSFSDRLALPDAH